MRPESVALKELASFDEDHEASLIQRKRVVRSDDVEHMHLGEARQIAVAAPVENAGAILAVVARD